VEETVEQLIEGAVPQAQPQPLLRTSRLTTRVPAEMLDRARERSVLRRLGDPQDVAGVVFFLCSEAARHITGAVIPGDGGYLVW